tara:strand:- start:1074 stop:2237 length:1164 start_codon:yes stop_codon:yes gene_type:complete
VPKRKKENIDKDEDDVDIEAGGQTFSGALDTKSMREMFNAWEKEASGLEGESIGSVTGLNLLQAIKSQGMTGRLRGAGPNLPNKGGVEIFKELVKIFNAKEFSPEQFDFLRELDSMMNTYSADDHPLNPANIRFDNPIDIDEKGRTLKPKEVYGHYRTDEYESAQKLKGKDRPAVPDSWYSDGRGAEPPMWQALYGDGNGDVFDGISLHQVVKKAIENFDKIELEITQDDPLDLTTRKLGTPQVAKILLTIPSIKAIVNTFIQRLKQNPTKTFPAKSCKSAMEANPIKLGARGSQGVKTILGIRGMKQDIKEMYVKISWRQCNNMAKILLGDNSHWTSAGKNSLRLGKKPTEKKTTPKPKASAKPKNDDTEKKSLDAVTDWRMIVKC